MSRRSIPTFAAFRRSEGAALSSLEAGQAYLRYFDDDPEMQDYIESRMLAGLLTEHSGEPDAIIVLLHGIRTFALWHHTVVDELRLLDPNVLVQPVRYKFVDIFTFLGPVKFRRSSIDRVMREVKEVIRLNPGVPVTVVAHSFGTYVTSEFLASSSDIRLRRLLLCGSIVREDFKWSNIRTRIIDGILNDAGTRDIWPLLAKHGSFGYGPSGRFGFGTTAVTDRFFDYGHSDFFSTQHIRHFWAPFLLNGQIVASSWNHLRPPHNWWESLLAWLPLKQIVAAVGCGVVALEVLLKLARVFG
jgi:pimeloyl-ACP methyl ester carboxylesterase